MSAPKKVIPAKPGDQRKLVAVMFTDIVGYSRMMHLDEAGTLKFLSVHNTLLQEQAKAHGGRVIKTIGDSLMMDFQSVVDAVNCAIAIQTRLHGRNEGLKPDQRQYIRIGIHLGDVVVAGDDILGEGVNIAARMEPLSPYGGICVSREVAAHLKGLRHIMVLSRGVQHLKNISHPVGIFQLWAPGMDPTAKRRFHWARRKPRFWTLAAGAAALVLLMVVLPRWMEWRDSRGWEPWLSEDLRDWGRFSESWQTEALSPGGTGLEGGWLILKKPVPVRAFRIRVAYRVRPGNPADLTLAALLPGQEGDGLFYRHSAEPQLSWVNDQVGRRLDGGVEDEALRVGNHPGTGERHWQMLTYDSGRLTAQSGGDGWWDRLLSNRYALRTWIRQAPSSGFFNFGLEGRGVRLERVEIQFKRASNEDDLRTRADAYALDGRTDTALKLYKDLFKMSADPEEQCGFLYRQALVYRSTGNMTEAVNLYYRILKDYPENPYSGYVRLDLGLIDLGLIDLGLAAKARKGKANLLAEQAQGYFSGLVKRQGGHPEATRAAYLMAENAFEHLGAREEAGQRALQIVQSGGPYAERTLAILLNAFQGPGGKPRQEEQARGLAGLKQLLKPGRLKGRLREKAAETLAEALRLSGGMAGLAALVTEACQPGAFSLAGREAVVRQWVLAEDAGLPEAESQALAGALEKKAGAALTFDRAYLRTGGSRLAGRAQAALGQAVRVEIREAVQKDPRLRQFMDWTRGEFVTRGGGEGAAVMPREDGGVKLLYKTTREADQVLVIEPGVGPYSVEGGEGGLGRAVDVRIYRKLSFKVQMPKRKKFRICLAELGADDPGMRYSRGPMGADGEQYELGEWTGTGQWQHLQVELKEAKPDLGWGNQEGDLRLDLEALGAVVLVVPAGQGSENWTSRTYCSSAS